MKVTYCVFVYGGVGREVLPKIQYELIDEDEHGIFRIFITSNGRGGDAVGGGAAVARAYVLFKLDGRHAAGRVSSIKNTLLHK